MFLCEHIFITLGYIPRCRIARSYAKCMFNFNFFFFLAAPHGMWDLSSQTRDRTRAPCSGSTVLTTGPPGKSPMLNFIRNCQTLFQSGYVILHSHLQCVRVPGALLSHLHLTLAISFPFLSFPPCLSLPPPLSFWFSHLNRCFCFIHKFICTTFFSFHI